MGLKNFFKSLVENQDDEQAKEKRRQREELKKQRKLESERALQQYQLKKEEEERQYRERITAEKIVQEILNFNVSKIALPSKLKKGKEYIDPSNAIKIISDSAELCTTTVSPRVYFMRYELIVKTLDKLDLLVMPFKYQLSVGYAKTEIIKYKDDLDKKFILRYWRSVINKAENMKTERGRLNQYIGFKEAIEEYSEHLSEENLSLVSYFLSEISKTFNT